MKSTESDDAIIQAAISAANNQKRITVFSPLVAAFMWYMKETTPRYSISEAARTYIEEGIENEYPELVKRIKEKLEKSD